MKTLLSLLLFAAVGFGTADSKFYDFKIQALDSDEVVDFSSFKGKKVLVVNVASKCGYTPQYTDLQKLYQRYQDELIVVGLPCDQFLGQELNEESAIKEFCSGEYNITFPMTTVIDVKGKKQHPLYTWLTNKSENGKGDYAVSWNFNKFLIDEEGNLIEYFGSSTEPFSDEIIKHLN